MKSNYKVLGEFIEPVNQLNDGMEVKELLGISNQKFFQNSHTNTIDIDLQTYRIVRSNQFAYNRATTRNGDKISIALRQGNDCIVSPSYRIFKSKDERVLNSEYLMMWFRRPEFDRYARFKSHGSAHEFFEYDQMCQVELPIPHIDKQREIVKEYNTIQNRIDLNQQLIQKLEETAQAIYREWFVDGANENWEEKSIGDLCSLITDGKHGDCQNEIDSGYYFVSVKDLINGEIFYEDVRQITRKDFEETHKRTDLKPGDILLTSSGTIGRMIIVKEDPRTYRTTLQKSVAILKPMVDQASSYYLYSLLISEMKNIIELAGGSTIANLLLGDLRRYNIRYPGQFLISKYEKTVTSIYNCIALKNKENQKLMELKGLLLSKLATLL
jgi:type I restriction enzyme, S subunit